MNRPPNWGDFARAPAPADDAAGESHEALTARLFDTPDGRRWLTSMRADKFGRNIAAGIADAELRFIEGQRQLLRDIDRAIIEGLEQIKRAKKTF